MNTFIYLNLLVLTGNVTVQFDLCLLLAFAKVIKQTCCYGEKVARQSKKGKGMQKKALQEGVG